MSFSRREISNMDETDQARENKHLTIVIAILAIILIASCAISVRNERRDLEDNCKHGSEAACVKLDQWSQADANSATERGW